MKFNDLAGMIHPWPLNVQAAWQQKSQQGVSRWINPRSALAADVLTVLEAKPN
jgi:hypothetical protein